MNLKERIRVMVELGKYMVSDDEDIVEVKKKASTKNGWFTMEFIDLALKNIAENFLDEDKLMTWVHRYHLDDNVSPKTVGIVMAGNIPVVGFHDFLCVFLSGHYQKVKLSEKDNVLLPHLIDKLATWNVTARNAITIQEALKDCDAYIATGSNNSSRYFNYYFGKYPSIIRKNKTSAAVIKGNETDEQLLGLADDVHTFFGLGCRNVTSIAVPVDYDFTSLLEAFRKYDYFSDHSKYKNNYDYNLALLIMNNQPYMSGESKILVQSNQHFAPVSTLHYVFYDDYEKASSDVRQNSDIQCVIGKAGLQFGKSQSPTLTSYADGADVMQFLLTI